MAEYGNIRLSNKMSLVYQAVNNRCNAEIMQL